MMDVHTQTHHQPTGAAEFRGVLSSGPLSVCVCVPVYINMLLFTITHTLFHMFDCETSLATCRNIHSQWTDMTCFFQHDLLMSKHFYVEEVIHEIEGTPLSVNTLI